MEIFLLFETSIRALWRSEEHTSELQSQSNLVCRLLLEKKKIKLVVLVRNRAALPAEPSGDELQLIASAHAFAQLAQLLCDSDSLFQRRADSVHIVLELN